MTTLMITHNMEDAIQYGQKIIIMSEGRILDFIDEKRKQNLTVKDLIHLYTQHTHDYHDHILLQ